MFPVHQVWPKPSYKAWWKGKEEKAEMDRPWVRQVPEGSEEQGKMEKTGCKIICGAPTTPADRGLMMMMMMYPISWQPNQMCWFTVNYNQTKQSGHTLTVALWLTILLGTAFCCIRRQTLLLGGCGWGGCLIGNFDCILKKTVNVRELLQMFIILHVFSQLFVDLFCLSFF